MKKLTIFLLLNVNIVGHAQNLVLNGRFEIPFLNDTCYSISKSFDMPYIPYWIKVYDHSPLYLNPSRNIYICGDIHEGSKHLKPFEGQGFISTRENYQFDGMKKLVLRYIGGNPVGGPTNYGLHQKLIQPMKKDSWYVVSYRYKMGFDRDEDSVGFMYRVAFSHFGILFSVDTPPSFLNYFRTQDEKYDPYLQDSILDTSFRWRLVERIYKADSNYRFISLARFTNITQSKYRLYFDKNLPGWQVRIFNQLDDIRLLPLDQYLRVTADTTLCQADSLELKVLGGLGPYAWRRESAPSIILSNSATLKIKVDTTALYQVMSPFDTASIMVYLDSFQHTYDTAKHISCDQQPITISAPNIFRWYDNTKDTMKVFANTGDYWYETINRCNVKRTTLKIVIDKNKNDTLKQISCDSFRYQNSTYKNSGNYTYSHKTINGCDSLHTLALSIHSSSFQSTKVTSCAPYRWLDSMYTKAGIYQRRLKTTYQCDSILELDLSIGLDNRLKIENGINYTSLQDNVSYQWYRCNPWRRITNETKKTFTTKTSGSYAVVLDDGKGCRDTSDCRELYSSQVSVVSGHQTWTVFPNPFKELFHISLDRTYKIIQIRLYNLLGRLVITETIHHNSEFRIKNSELPKGTYYLQVETETTSQFFNLLKE